MRSLLKKSESSPIDDLRSEMDHLFDEMVPFSWVREKRGDGYDLWSPNTDMIETDERYVIHLDLPGIPKEEISISFEDNRLTVSGERRQEEKQQKENYMRRERYYGGFVRSFTFPNTVEENGIKARFKDGVLTITLRKAEKSKPKTVKIE